MADDLDARLDRLYEQPPEEFVAARDALAKELQGDARSAVKALRRPSVVAGLANRLARDEPKALAALLEAGERLREAHLGGGGDVRAAVTAQRAAIDALVKLARKAGGSGANVDRLRALLQAVAGDDELGAALESGRIEREPDAGGSWPALSLSGDDQAGPRKRNAAPTKVSRTPAKGKPKAEAAAAAEKARRKAQAQERARLREEAEDRRRERARESARAQKEADRAQTRLERATASTATARDALAAAEAVEAEVREEAQRALRALKTAQAHLQEATDEVAALGPD